MAQLQAWLDNNGSATAEDGCSDVTWTNDHTTLSDDCGASGVTTVVFTATDDCGNESTTTATFTVEDTTAPELTTPAVALNLECSADDQQSAINNWLALNGGATTDDLCSSTNIV